MNLLVHYQSLPSYQIVIENDFSDLVTQIDRIGKKYRKACIVTDSNVKLLHYRELKEVLRSHFDVLICHVIPAGEANKNLDQIALLYKDLIEAHFDRNDLLIAFGGGVIGDMTGFTAATYLRGIDFIQIPTTLLAMVDSSVGGKTGVDCMQYKNMVGAFYMPKLVYMNLSMILTLPQEQFACGMGEVIKTACIRDTGLLDYLKVHRDDIQARDCAAMSHVIYTCCNIKRMVVEEDPTEKGVRAILNFGHTIGHAVEKLSNFHLYHGQCVAVGMTSALYVSLKTDHITQSDMNAVIRIMQSYDLPAYYDASNGPLDAQAIYAATKSDKKMAGNKLKFIRLDHLGDAVIDTELSESMILDSIQYILEEH